MDREQEVIHKQMEETRADLTNKLSALENQVSGTVQTATNAVETTKDAVTDTVQAVTGTVESVKETVEDVTEKLHDTVEGVTETVQHAVEGVKESVQETFQTVAESFNLKLQCERHPWAIFGGAFAVGCLGGYLLGGSSRQNTWKGSWESRSDGATSHAAPERVASSTSSSGDQNGGLGGWFWEQLSGFKGLALGATFSMVRDLVTQALPEEIKQKVSEEVDKLTRSLGGEPLKGSLLGGNQGEGEREESHQATGEDFHNSASGMSRSESNGGQRNRPEMAMNSR